MEPVFFLLFYPIYTGLFFFCRIYTFIGVPADSISRILFSRKRLYGSFTYCKLANNERRNLYSATA